MVRVRAVAQILPVCMSRDQRPRSADCAAKLIVASFSRNDSSAHSFRGKSRGKNLTDRLQVRDYFIRPFLHPGSLTYTKLHGLPLRLERKGRPMPT